MVLWYLIVSYRLCPVTIKLERFILRGIRSEILKVLSGNILSSLITSVTLNKNFQELYKIKALLSSCRTYDHIIAETKIGTMIKNKVMCLPVLNMQSGRLESINIVSEAGKYHSHLRPCCVEQGVEECCVQAPVSALIQALHHSLIHDCPLLNVFFEKSSLILSNIQ